MEQFERIRHAKREEGLSMRALARRHGVHRRTVRQAVAAALPPPRGRGVRPAPVTGAWRPLIRSWLIEDRTAPRKQRHTARRIWQRLLEEHGADLAESTVREVVRELRTEIGGGISSVMIVACHAPGEEAEVDFGEATIILAGEATKVHLFHLRLNSSGKAVTLAFLAPDQTAFLEGHAIAFARLGGVPTLGFAPHPLIEEAIREAVRCLRADLYLPALAMLAKAAEGFWTLLAVALGAAAPGEASAVKLARGAGDGSVPFGVRLRVPPAARLAAPARVG